MSPIMPQEDMETMSSSMQELYQLPRQYEDARTAVRRNAAGRLVETVSGGKSTELARLCAEVGGVSLSCA